MKLHCWFCTNITSVHNIHMVNPSKGLCTLCVHTVDILWTYVCKYKYTDVYSIPQCTSIFIYIIYYPYISFFMFSFVVLLYFGVYILCFTQLILPVAMTQFPDMDTDPKSFGSHFMLCHIKWKNRPNQHGNIPLIVVWFVVPDFWSHIIRCPNIGMSVGLWAAKTKLVTR